MLSLSHLGTLQYRHIPAVSTSIYEILIFVYPSNHELVLSLDRVLPLPILGFVKASPARPYSSPCAPRAPRLPRRFTCPWVSRSSIINRFPRAPPPTPHVLVMLYVASSLGFERIAYSSFLTYCLSSLVNLFHVLLIIRAPRRSIWSHAPSALYNCLRAQCALRAFISLCAAYIGLVAHC